MSNSGYLYSTDLTRNWTISLEQQLGAFNDSCCVRAVWDYRKWTLIYMKLQQIILLIDCPVQWRKNRLHADHFILQPQPLCNASLIFPLSAGCSSISASLSPQLMTGLRPVCITGRLQDQLTLPVLVMDTNRLLWAGNQLSYWKRTKFLIISHDTHQNKITSTYKVNFATEKKWL